MGELNWAGNVVYGAGRVQRPASVEELAALIAAAPRIRVLGSRHSFNTIADSEQLVSLRALPATIELDRERGTVACPGAMTYGELAPALAAAGVALANLGSLPHISVAGSIATATHGSGDRNGNLATAVAGLELVTSAGETLAVSRGERDFDGMVVALGAIGAVTRVTLDVEPAYGVAQQVYEGLRWDALAEHFDELTACGYSVSVFTRWEDEEAKAIVPAPRKASVAPAAARPRRSDDSSAGSPEEASADANALREELVKAIVPTSAEAPTQGRQFIVLAAWKRSKPLGREQEQSPTMTPAPQSSPATRPASLFNSGR